MGRHLSKAHKDLAGCEEQHARWQAESGTRRAELADLESRLGDDVLADEASASRLTRQVADLRAALDTADRTAAAAASRCAAARVDVDRARAVDLREQAADLRKQAAARAEVTVALLAKLEAHEGAQYVPYEPKRDAVALAAAGSITWARPRTTVLLWQADALETDAAALDEKIAGQDRQHSNPPIGEALPATP